MRALRQPRGRRLGRATYALSVLLGLAVIALHVMRIGHALFVSHQVCEHGTFVHAEAGSHARHERREGAERGVTARGDEGPSADHDHCDPLATTPAIVAVAEAFSSPALLDGEVLPWSVRAPPPSALSVLIFAPKNSPPV